MRGVHLHHLVPGIVATLAAGTAIIGFRPSDDSMLLLSALFGAGAALILDEFALVLHLDDVYWTKEGRSSIEATLIGFTFAVLCLLATAPLGGDPGKDVPHWVVRHVVPTHGTVPRPTVWSLCGPRSHVSQTSASLPTTCSSPRAARARSRSCPSPPSVATSPEPPDRGSTTLQPEKTAASRSSKEREPSSSSVFGVTDESTAGTSHLHLAPTNPRPVTLRCSATGTYASSAAEAV